MDGLELTVDARGLACPIPVVRAKQALEGLARGRVIVLVDDPAARENVSRLAAHLGCALQVQEQAGGLFRLLLEKAGPEGGPP